MRSYSSVEQTLPPCLLMTRPRADGRMLGVAARQLGWKVVLEPLLTVRWCDAELPFLERLQGLLFTSANGVRAWARRVPSQRTLPVYAIGDATALIARSFGFTQVMSASSRRDDLIGQVLLTCRSQGGILLHVAGSVTAGSLAESLKAEGFDAREVILYESEPVKALSPSTEKALLGQRIHAIALLSPRTARILIACLHRQLLLSCCSALTLLCLSGAIAQAAQQSIAELGYSWGQIRVASRPDRRSWLELLQTPIGH